MAKANAKEPKASAKRAGAPEHVGSGDQPVSGIAGLEVEGFKSLREKTEIAIRPLTILAGANSSGKSSMMQPILLMKQTLEAPSDPGVFLLDGPNVRFTSADQVVSRFGKNKGAMVVVQFRTIHDRRMEVAYRRVPGGGFDIPWMSEKNKLGAGTTLEYGTLYDSGEDRTVALRERCFLVRWQSIGEEGPILGSKLGEPLAVTQVRKTLLSMIHVPAMHGHAERTYRTSGIGPDYPGTFEPYVASIIHDWQTRRDHRLADLGAALENLGLTWKVQAVRIDDSRVELRVGRLKKKSAASARDLVSIADVGFGVSQCLPVLVGLLVGREGQLVYIEEPETHLHPRAQVALAQILADAAKRGVRVVIETHSALLLLAVQTLVAEGTLRPELVALHWFSLDEDGATKVRSADLDATGAFGDWPEDFAEITLYAQARYLDAAEKRLTKGAS